MGQELAGTAVDGRRQVEKCGGRRNHVEEVTGGWLFARARAEGERFEVVGKREWVLENGRGR